MLPRSISSLQMSVPDPGRNDDNTRSGTLYFAANSTERRCSTREPCPASSSISSKEMRDRQPRLRDHARIGGVDAVDVGEDLALVGLERNRQRHGAGVRAAAADGGDVAVVIDALETGDDRHIAGVEGLAQALRFRPR